MASLEKYVQKIHKKLNNERLEEHKVREQATMKAKSWNYATLKKAWIQRLFGRIHAPRNKKRWKCWCIILVNAEFGLFVWYFIPLFDFHAFWIFLTVKGDKIPQRTGSITNHTGYFESKSCTVSGLFYSLSLILSLLSYIIISNSHNINNNFVWVYNRSH